jgi:hypothetical protein
VESDPVAAGAVLGVLHHRVVRAAVEDWVLRLEFDNSAKLVCPPHERWEAWQAQLPDAPSKPTPTEEHRLLHPRLRVWCWPGNTGDQTVIRQVKDDLRGWRLGRVVTVVDRGFASDDNRPT